tara:strand:+ start:298 stop:576 length:279 start_codon:yes stop_codon:yes gene_type:complete
MKKLYSIHRKCHAIYEEFGGYDYNDKMIYQLRGLDADIEECEHDAEEFDKVDILHQDIYKYTLANAESTLLWFKWTKKLMVLKSKEPSAIFG